jgi:hypothetical protein
LQREGVFSCGARIAYPAEVTFRDDRDALRAHIDELGRELDRARARVEALEAGGAPSVLPYTE